MLSTSFFIQLHYMRHCHLISSRKKQTCGEIIKTRVCVFKDTTLDWPESSPVAVGFI